MDTNRPMETDPLNWLLENGFPLPWIAWQQDRGITAAEAAAGVQAALDRGKKLEEIRAEERWLHPDWFPGPEEPYPGDDGDDDLFKPLSAFAEEDAEWLVEGYISKKDITLLSAEGGVGKTTCWVTLAAAVSSGSRCFLDSDDAPDREPGTVLFLSTEDSVSVILKKRLVAAGADEDNIIALNIAADKNGKLRKLKFGSEELKELIALYKPTLCVFDPIQAFIPRGTNMGDRGAMRDCIQTLAAWGVQYGTTFLIVSHTNKRQQASGRDRIADSADLWDISRSVLMMGWTQEEGVRYLSHEKCNYGPKQPTILFTIDGDGVIRKQGTVDKRDYDFMKERPRSRATSREECKEWIIRTLEEHGGEMRLQDLHRLAETCGHTDGTMKHAKEELAKANQIRTYSRGYGSDKHWWIELTYPVE